MLSPSARHAAAPTRLASSFSCEMDAGELMVECNFPELLIRDLAASEDIFASRDMTAGLPCGGLEAPSPCVPYRPRYQQDQQQEEEVDASPSYTRSLFADEDQTCAEQFGGVDEFGPRDGRRDSSSVTSSAGACPFSIRTRRQSVATAATSVSGRSSSLFSRDTVPPISPGNSPCSSNSRGESPHGTWYEDEPESPRDEPGGSILIVRTSISDPHQPNLNFGDHINMSASQKAASDTARLPRTPMIYSPGSCYSTYSRPHTPASQVQRERPRIIDIPPVPMGPKRISSRHRVLCDPESALSVSKSKEATMVEGQWQASCSVDSQESHSGIHLLATANGRTVIDASAPPPIPLKRRDPPTYDHHPHSPPSGPIDESDISDDEEAPGPGVYTRARAEAAKPSLADIRRWADAGIETRTSAQIPLPPTSAPHPPGVPLPPEVIESLRVSISCFPETMLLTSSLSIETIRAYSRKVKHRPAMNRHLRSPDTANSIQSSDIQNTWPSKRWKMSWLAHGGRSSKQHQSKPPYHFLLQYQQPAHLDLSTSTLATERPPFSTATIASSSPLWAPIQKIFPSASAHLCDALYAHLLAYNYIRSLCPTPRPVTTPSSSSTTPSVPTPPTRPRTSPQSRTGSSSSTSPSLSDDTAPRNTMTRGIPHKAASLLGMDDPVSAAAAYRDRQQVQVRSASSGDGSGSSTGRSRLLLRRTSHSQPLGGLLFGWSSSASLSWPGGDVVPRSRTSGGGGFGNGDQEAGGSAAMRELLAGLGRCVNLLVATMNNHQKGGGGLADDAGLLIREDGEAAVGGVEPVLMRALCEVVRCAEEGCLGGN